MAYDTPVMRGEAVDAGVAVETAESTAVAASASRSAPDDGRDPDGPMVDPIDGVCLDDTGTECSPAPIDIEPITITLTNARPSLEQLWASDDTVWLLPGYAFDSPDGGLYSVLAVEDQYIEVTPAVEVPAPDTVAGRHDRRRYGGARRDRSGHARRHPERRRGHHGAGRAVESTRPPRLPNRTAGCSASFASTVSIRRSRPTSITNRANVATEAGVVTAIVSFGISRLR